MVTNANNAMHNAYIPMGNQHLMSSMAWVKMSFLKLKNLNELLVFEALFP